MPFITSTPTNSQPLPIFHVQHGHKEICEIRVQLSTSDLTPNTSRDDLKRKLKGCSVKCSTKLKCTHTPLLSHTQFVLSLYSSYTQSHSFSLHFSVLHLCMQEHQHHPFHLLSPTLFLAPLSCSFGCWPDCLVLGNTTPLHPLLSPTTHIHNSSGILLVRGRLIAL